MYERALRPDELMHFGVKGMHWGIRRYQPYPKGATRFGKEIGEAKRAKLNAKRERKLTRFMKRKVAADERNMKIKAKAERGARTNYNDSHKQYEKAMGKISFSKKKKAENINRAYDNLHKSEKILEERRRETLRAEDLYKRDANYYVKHVKSLQSKYGNNKIKDPQTKILKEKGRILFEKDPYVRTVLKTGPTMANIPFFGTKYTAKYVGIEDRASVDEDLRKRRDQGR